jgi:surface protein
MSEMFSGCSSLTSLDLSNFKTDNVTDMKRMFSYCFSLTSLDVSTFKTDNVTNMAEMFRTCRNLERIISNTFSKQSQMNSTDAFAYCLKLVGSNGTVFDSTYTDAEYARIDGENGLPGYFTDPANQAKITLMNSKNDGLKYLDYITINSAYTIPTLESYTAVVTDNNGNTYSDGDTITINQDITLTFTWTA